MDEGAISRRLKQIRHNIKDYNGEKRNANATSFRGIERSETPDPKFDSRTLEKYKHDLNEERRDLEDFYSKFYEHPGSHSAYKEEWELFWQRRSVELIRVRIDPLNYNFDSEWKDVFYKFLREEQANKYAEIKKLLFDKYSRINKSQWRNRRDSKNESRSSRSSHRSNFRSRSRSNNSRHHYRKSRSHDNYRQRSRRRSRSHSRDIKKRIKVEKFEEVKEIQTRLCPHTVAKVCHEILKLDHKVKFKREKVRGLMEKAMNFEKCQLREYTMTEDEHEKFINLKEDFDYMIKGKSKFPSNIVDQINKIRFNLSILIKRWKCHMTRRNSLTSKIKCNNNKTFFNGKKFSFKFAGKSKHREEIFPNRNQGMNYISPWNFDNYDDDSPQSSSSNSTEKKQFHSNNAPSTSLAFPFNPAIKQEINFLNTLKEIKKERTDIELEILNQEKKKLEEMIFNERKVDSSPLDSSQEREQGLVIDETRNADRELDNPIEEGTLTAADITNEELIELFKDFETSSEEELFFVQQVMGELKHTDPPRFLHLKTLMEEIQNSIELEFMNFISNELEEGSINICVKQEEVTGENEICLDNNKF